MRVRRLHYVYSCDCSSRYVDNQRYSFHFQRTERCSTKSVRYRHRNVYQATVHRICTRRNRPQVIIADKVNQQKYHHVLHTL